MNQEPMISFLVESCKKLSIKVKEKNDVFTLHIPKKLQKMFNEESKLVIERKDIHSQSFIIKKIASLIKEFQVTGSIGIRHVEDAEKDNHRYLYAWFKMRIRSFNVNEFIDCVCYDFQTKQISFIPLTTSNTLFEDLKENDKVQSLSTEEMNTVLQELENCAHEHFHSIIEEEKTKANAFIEKEIARIEEYFEIVKKEHQSSYSNTTYEDYGIINKEKDNLIFQQHQKYRIDDENISFSPLSYVFVIEKAVSL